MALIWKGEAAREIARAAALGAATKGAEKILNVAINKTPLLSGTLRRSGCVTVGTLPNPDSIFQTAKAGRATKRPDSKVKALAQAVKGEELAVYVTFNTPYALDQHEGNHQHKNGERKYLEKAFNEQSANVEKLMDLSVKAALAKGG